MLNHNKRRRKAYLDGLKSTPTTEYRGGLVVTWDVVMNMKTSWALRDMLIRYPFSKRDSVLRGINLLVLNKMIRIFQKGPKKFEPLLYLFCCLV